MKDEEKRLADAEQKSERRRIQEENVRRKEAAKVKEVKAQERVRDGRHGALVHWNGG